MQLLQPGLQAPEHHWGHLYRTLRCHQVPGISSWQSPTAHQQNWSHRLNKNCKSTSPASDFTAQAQLRSHLSPILLQTPCAHSQVCFPGSLLNQPQQDCKPAVTKQWDGPCPEARLYPCSSLFPLN